MNKFRAVTGDIACEYMGKTYTHEHLHIHHPGTDQTLSILDDEKTAKEVELFKNIGGTTIVEATPPEMGRDLSALKMISELSGVNIIGSTGNFLAEFNESELRYVSVDEIAERYIFDIEEGVGEQKIKAGQIKCATSLRVIHPVEYKTLDAAVIAQKKTNAPIWVHHGGILGVEIAQYLESKGADLSKVILGHTDRNPDHFEHIKIAKTGINLSVDNLARVVRYPVQENIDVIKNLLDKGFFEQIFISADFGRYTYYKSYGGGPGLEYILGTFVPRLQEQLGLSDTEIETLFVRSPQRVFCQF